VKHVEIFTDGACKGNPGPAAGRDPEAGRNEKECRDRKSYDQQSHEMTAVIRALNALTEPCEVTLHTTAAMSSTA